MDLALMTELAQAIEAEGFTDWSKWTSGIPSKPGCYLPRWKLASRGLAPCWRGCSIWAYMGFPQELYAQQ